MLNKNSTKWSLNRFEYYSDGDCFVAGSKVGKFGNGFKKGEIVTVALDLNSGNIQWKVEG